MVDLGPEKKSIALFDVVAAPTTESEHDAGTNIDDPFCLLRTGVMTVADVELAAICEGQSEVAELASSAIAPQTEGINKGLGVLPIDGLMLRGGSRYAKRTVTNSVRIGNLDSVDTVAFVVPDVETGDWYTISVQGGAEWHHVFVFTRVGLANSMDRRPWPISAVVSVSELKESRGCQGGSKKKF